MSRKLFKTLAFRMKKMKIISKKQAQFKKNENFKLNPGLDFCRCKWENLL